MHGLCRMYKPQMKADKGSPSRGGHSKNPCIDLLDFQTQAAGPETRSPPRPPPRRPGSCRSPRGVVATESLARPRPTGPRPDSPAEVWPVTQYWPVTQVQVPVGDGGPRKHVWNGRGPFSISGPDPSPGPASTQAGRATTCQWPSHGGHAGARGLQ